MKVVSGTRNTLVSTFKDTALFVVLAMAACAAFPRAGAQALPQSRITGPIRADQMTVLHGTVHPLVSVAKDEGRLGGSTVIPRMSLVFLRSPAQQADLKKLLAAQQTKGSPMYHQWLKPGQFAARYGVSAQDLAQVAAWLKQQGFQVAPIPASGDRIDFTGTASQVEAAFQTEMHRYLLHGVEGWANSTEISVPQAIAGMTLGVLHLNTFRPEPQIHKTAVRMSQNKIVQARPFYTVQTQNGLVNFLAPSDVHTIYNVKGLYNANFTGTGQTMAIAGQTDITQYQSDIANFRSLSGLNPQNLPTQILVPNTGTKQAYPSDLEEADLDVEWSGAIAKDATILFVTVGNSPNYGVFDSVQYAIQTPLVNNTQYVPVISISYGNCEQAFAGSNDIQNLEQLFQQANAQGQTIVASSGDSGSGECNQMGKNAAGQFVGATKGLAVDYPASSVYVTGAGGTSFSGDVNNQSQYWSSTNNSNNGSALSYIPETTWNDTVTLAQLTSNGSLSASGGGVSGLFDKPAWQVGNTPDDGKRDVPDVSLAADPDHDGYVLCTEETTGSGSSETFSGMSSCAYPLSGNDVAYFDANQQAYLYGGTSVVAPELAAMITLWNQQQGNSKGVGNANPLLYSAAKDTPAAFHDVTTGSNAVVCQQGSPNCVADPNNSGNYILSCCDAGPSYDLATGLGSVDAAALGAAWPAITTIPTVTSNFSLASSGGISLKPGGTGTTTITISPSSTFSGSVALACSNLPVGVTCSFTPTATVPLVAGTPQKVTLTLTATTAAQLKTPFPQRSSRPGWPAEAALASIFGVCLFGAGCRKKVIPAQWAARLGLALVLGLGLIAAGSATGCGSGTKAVTGTGGGSGGSGGGSVTTTSFTVTGSSTSNGTASSASTDVSLTIQ
ncbi:MAG TPA: S53 family serine peptidase [Acidobacteriaceae bacterium]|nr:S53 family serine peptidase [Acidobacteriaceae bacterium]